MEIEMIWEKFFDELDEDIQQIEETHSNHQNQLVLLQITQNMVFIYWMNNQKLNYQVNRYYE